MDLTGKTVLITGATSGIGRAVAEVMAGHGANVAFSGTSLERGRSVLEAIESKGGIATFIPADLLDPAAPRQLVERTVQQYGALDIVINNAALICNKTVEEAGNDDWDSLFSVNLKAPFFIIQAAVPYLEKSKGCVINMGSTNSMVNSRNNFIYDSLKSALNHLTRGLSMDLRGRGVRVNALLAGGTETPNLLRWMEQVTGDNEQSLQRIEDEKRLGLVATPEQIAHGVLLLCLPEASWINGTLIPIDNGFHIGR